MTNYLRRIAGRVAALSLLASLHAPSNGFAAEPLQAGQNFRDCAEGCPEMTVVPAGSFTMGSATEPVGGPPRRVTIAKPFAVGKFEVTYEEFDACVAARACSRKTEARWGKGSQPVVNVSWDDAKQYVSWLSSKTGKHYRLLSEAEWEHAARAGSTTLYSWGDAIGSGNSNCRGCGSQWDGKQPAPVGSFKPNAFGLYDMHGNVWEWVEDCFDYSYDRVPDDGGARTKECEYEDHRIQRGGAFLHEPEAVRSTSRNYFPRDGRANGVGFRVARTL